MVMEEIGAVGWIYLLLLKRIDLQLFFKRNLQDLYLKTYYYHPFIHAITNYFFPQKRKISFKKK